MYGDDVPSGGGIVHCRIIGVVVLVVVSVVIAGEEKVDGIGWIDF